MASEHRRVGIYGGTFSPPHNGHVRAALAFLEALQLDELYVVPAARLPHKTVETEPALRLAMTRGAFDGVDPRVRVSDYEIRCEGISYTYRTLAHFSEGCGGKLFLLCGADLFLTLDSWRCPERIFNTAVPVVTMRSSVPAERAAVVEKAEEYARRFGVRTEFVPLEPLELSSTLIRQMVKEGRDISAFVPSEVCRIITMHNLYRSDCV